MSESTARIALTAALAYRDENGDPFLYTAEQMRAVEAERDEELKATTALHAEAVGYAQRANAAEARLAEAVTLLRELCASYEWTLVHGCHGEPVTDALHMPLIRAHAFVTEYDKGEA